MNNEQDSEDDVSSNYMKHAVSERLQQDIIICPFITVLVFGIHCSGVFTVQYLELILRIMVVTLGFTLHYILPRLRDNYPWLIFSKPILKSEEYGKFEVTRAARLMWYERALLYAESIEKNLLNVLFVITEITRDSHEMVQLYGNFLGTLLIVLIASKLVRSGHNTPHTQYIIYLFAYLFVTYDARSINPGPLILSYFVFGILFVKLQGLYLKLHFWLVYIAPWQITWGSAFHAFAQPFSVPHSAFLTMHALLASVTEAPFSPLIGSAIFLSSYARPLKFWERNYKTKRIDHSNTRLVNQLDRANSDDNNLNSIFYEHLTYSLQKTLAGDITLGRWGNVYAGDCFILASDYLNALVHVIERSNGVITFQLRGLEFSGTYCQQREVEAISEGADSSEHCCCFTAAKFKGLLSFNAAFNMRCLAWQVSVTNYVLDGYSITDNNAATMLGVFDLRKILISYIIKALVFFLVGHESLGSWLDNDGIREQISPCERPDYADVDTTFAVAIDDDYDLSTFGVSLNKFKQVYGAWITYCVVRSNHKLDREKRCKLKTLCFAISVLGRRALGTASYNLSPNLDSFLYGLHALFKGDFRITSSKDEWVFRDMNLLRQVVAPGVRTALKLHQDHFTCPDEFDQNETLYNAIEDYSKTMVITHEGDPEWRKAVLTNTPSLLALRRVLNDNSIVDQYSVITLNHRALGFNVVKVNRECVRGLWAGQQNELVFLRNRNPERGSIQNAKQVLRNMINSSCDQPIGYPIYVSPLTTSYASTNQQLLSVLGQPITFQRVKDSANRFVNCVRSSCSGSCNSGMSGQPPIQSIQMSNLSARNTDSRSSVIATNISQHMIDQQLMKNTNRLDSLRPPRRRRSDDSTSITSPSRNDSSVNSMTSRSRHDSSVNSMTSRSRHDSNASGKKCEVTITCGSYNLSSLRRDNEMKNRTEQLSLVEDTLD